MSITGSLDVVTVPELLQFICLSRATGTLVLRSQNHSAEVGFHEGSIINGWSEDSGRLGDTLVSLGTVEQSVVDKAVELQSMAQPRRHLGDILVAAGALEIEDLQRAVVAQVEETVGKILHWEQGDFDFTREAPRNFDPDSAETGFIVSGIKLDVQEVLLRLAKEMDEERRDQQASILSMTGDAPSAAPLPFTGGQERLPEESAADPDRLPMADGPLPQTVTDDEILLPEADADDEEIPLPVAAIHVATGDDLFYSSLHKRITRDSERQVQRVALESADPEEASTDDVALVLVDLRHNSDADLLTNFRERYEHAELIAVIDDVLGSSMAYAFGADSAVPGEIEAVASVVERRTPLQREHARPARRVNSDEPLAKLRRVTADIRTGMQSSNIVLSLMSVVSESAERAIIFLVRQSDLLAIGAFGFDSEGRPLALRCQGEPTHEVEGTILETAIDASAAQRFSFAEVTLPESLSKILGSPPANGEAIALPIVGSERVLALIYCDSGEQSERIRDLKVLELAAQQVGMALENVLLRRHLTRRPSSTSNPLPNAGNRRFGTK